MSVNQGGNTKHKLSSLKSFREEGFFNFIITSKIIIYKVFELYQKGQVKENEL